MVFIKLFTFVLVLNVLHIFKIYCLYYKIVFIGLQLLYMKFLHYFFLYNAI